MDAAATSLPVRFATASALWRVWCVRMSVREVREEGSDELAAAGGRETGGRPWESDLTLLTALGIALQSHVPQGTATCARMCGVITALRECVLHVARDCAYLGIPPNPARHFF